MKTIEVYTTNDKFVVRTEDFEPALLNKELNNGEITTVLIDYLIISRLDVKRIVVLNEIADNSVKKVKVSLRNGQSVEIPVEADFDIKFLNAQLNSSSVTTVLIGSNIYQKFEVVQVVLIKEEPKESEQPPVTEPEQPTDPVTPPVTEPPTESDTPPMTEEPAKTEGN
ncbi:hypothetical protein GTY48_15530 [Bacillus thuringiensis]|uniref:hypothetical protein n=1 Tax=Bacillus thuringiensis TaxID=1428 RepID=UPI00136E5E81|nr:hypothetical protein [Bacillus thuringiensis]MYW24979.1 hypothetical protein [Bacillus thuringiensis]MYW25058.1 hypothetical protein [Bacillus thuringiensis]